MYKSTASKASRIRLEVADFGVISFFSMELSPDPELQCCAGKDVAKQLDTLLFADLGQGTLEQQFINSRAPPFQVPE